jgi:hypothetical protein
MSPAFAHYDNEEGYPKTVQWDSPQLTVPLFSIASIGDRRDGRLCEKVYHPVIASERSERGNPSPQLVRVDCRVPAVPSLAMTCFSHSLPSLLSHPELQP